MKIYVAITLFELKTLFFLFPPIETFLSGKERQASNTQRLKQLLRPAKSQDSHILSPNSC